MLINFECKRCQHVFDCDVGAVSMSEGADRPHFEKRPLCPTCGEILIDDVRLTELGQDQLAAAILGFDDDFGDDFEGFADTQCYGCDRYLPVNDLQIFATNVPANWIATLSGNAIGIMPPLHLGSTPPNVKSCAGKSSPDMARSSNSLLPQKNQ